MWDYEKIDDREEKRTSDLLKTYNSGKGINDAEILNSEIIPKILKEGPLAHWHSYRIANPALPPQLSPFPAYIG